MIRPLQVLHGAPGVACIFDIAREIIRKFRANDSDFPGKPESHRKPRDVILRNVRRCSSAIAAVHRIAGLVRTVPGSTFDIFGPTTAISIPTPRSGIKPCCEGGRKSAQTRRDQPLARRPLLPQYRKWETCQSDGTDVAQERPNCSSATQPIRELGQCLARFESKHFILTTRIIEFQIHKPGSIWKREGCCWRGKRGGWR